MNTENCKTAENPFVFLDLKFGNIKAGRVVIELFQDRVPKTVENFRCLCTGEKGVGKSGKTLHLKNTLFHRVVPIFMVQGGDITKNNGSGGESIYGENFEDENFTVSHSTEGMVGMANKGPNTNNSQFYITTVPCPHLDGLNVAFGIVRKGFNIIVEMAEVQRDEDTPIESIVIENCGEFHPGEAWCLQENDGTSDIYPPWPNDWDCSDETNQDLVETAINNIKDSGNCYFRDNNLVDSERKYKKALRYIDWFLGFDNQGLTERLQTLRINSILNLALVKLKKKQYKDVISLCNQVLDKFPDNGKALYRRAQARLALKDYDHALNDLSLVTNLHPNDNVIQSVLHITRQKKLSYLKKEKRFYENFFKN